MSYDFNFKELDEVIIKATQPMSIGNHSFEVGETIAFFDDIQVANFNEIKQGISVRGGKGNQIQLTWEQTPEIRLSFSQGKFNKQQFALLEGAGFFTKTAESPTTIFKREEKESNSQGKIIFAAPPKAPLFVYSLTGEKIPYTIDSNTQIDTGAPYTSYIIDYFEQYNKGVDIFSFGQEQNFPFCALQGKMKVKEDVNGAVQTGIIQIPKLKIVSNMSIRLGTSYSPVVGDLSAIALPWDKDGNIMNILLLED